MLNVNENSYGYVLSNESEKYVLNKTKYPNSKAPFYLKQVAPQERYLSGMFYDKRKNMFVGKTTEGERINLILDGSECILKIQNK